MPIRTKMMKAPAELQEVADERDGLIDEQIEALIPPVDTPFNVKVLEALARAIGAISKLMGIEVEVEGYSEPSTTLDPDVARFLFMISQAAKDYGKPLPVSLEDIKGDNELTTITAHLKRLAEDEEFRAFLEGDEEPAEMEVEVDVRRGNMDEEDDYFMSRM